MHTELNYDTVFNAQEHFRLLLDSMARPGKINTFGEIAILPPDGLNESAALTGFALLNPDVTYYIAEDTDGVIGTYLQINTGAQQAEISSADYIFLSGEYFSEELFGARVGIPTYPEDSATLVISVEQISEEPIEGGITITLKGPGVNGEAVAYVSGLGIELLEFVKEQNAEYPLGIDLIIAGKQNDILCIPRSNKFTFSED